MLSAYVFSGLQLSPHAMRRIVAHIDPSRYDEHLDPDRFSPREVLAHLADWEPTWRGRIEQAVASPGCTVEVFDEGQRAIDLHYRSIPVEQSIETLLRERGLTIELLKGLGESDWPKQYMHPERGIMSVLETTVAQLGHDIYHVEQLTAYLGPV